jgi:hypothetical protein
LSTNQRLPDCSQAHNDERAGFIPSTSVIAYALSGLLFLLNSLVHRALPDAIAYALSGLLFLFNSLVHRALPALPDAIAYALSGLPSKLFIGTTNDVPMIGVACRYFYGFFIIRD